MIQMEIIQILSGTTFRMTLNTVLHHRRTHVYWRIVIKVPILEKGRR